MAGLRQTDKSLIVAPLTEGACEVVRQPYKSRTMCNTSRSIAVGGAVGVIGFWSARWQPVTHDGGRGAAPCNKAKLAAPALAVKGVGKGGFKSLQAPAAPSPRAGSACSAYSGCAWDHRRFIQRGQNRLCTRLGGVKKRMQIPDHSCLKLAIHGSIVSRVRQRGTIFHFSTAWPSTWDEGPLLKVKLRISWVCIHCEIYHAHLIRSTRPVYA